MPVLAVLAAQARTVEAKGLGLSPRVTTSRKPVSFPRESGMGSRTQQLSFLNFPSYHLANDNKYT